MQVQHKQAIVVLQKVLIVTIFITISAMSAHATTLIGKDIRDILSKIESKAFLNTIYFCKSDSDYFGIPKENIRAEYDFFGGGAIGDNKSYKALLVYSKNTVNKGTNYVDDIYFVPRDMKEGESPYKVEGIVSVTAKDGTTHVGFMVEGKRYDKVYDELDWDSGLIIPGDDSVYNFLYLITNNEKNPYPYVFVNGQKILSKGVTEYKNAIYPMADKL